MCVEGSGVMGLNVARAPLLVGWWDGWVGVREIPKVVHLVEGSRESHRLVSGIFTTSEVQSRHFSN